MFLATTSFSQVAMIKDKDGFTNVRSGPNNDSTVIYKVENFELFFVFEAAKNNENWLEVYIPKNQFALGCDGSDYIKGYMHSSRIIDIYDLEKYEGDDFSFKYKLDSFSFENKIVDYVDDKWISKINGRRYYGTDGETPKIEVKSIEIIMGGKEISVPKILFSDLFECSNKFEVYKYLDAYIVDQWNSDGAGGYGITWLIDSDGVKQRLIFIP